MVDTFRIMADDVALAEMVRVDVGERGPAGAVAVHQMNLVPIAEAVGALSAGDAGALTRFLLTVASARVDFNMLDEKMAAALTILHGYANPGVIYDATGAATLVAGTDDGEVLEALCRVPPTVEGHTCDLDVVVHDDGTFTVGGLAHEHGVRISAKSALQFAGALTRMARKVLLTRPR
jgi:hypothetical protein